MLRSNRITGLYTAKKEPSKEDSSLIPLPATAATAAEAATRETTAA